MEPNFDPKAKEVLETLIAKSEKIAVIPQIAIGLLEDQGLPINKCIVTPHGCPDIPFINSEKIKPTMGLKNRFVISAFGLISHSKGTDTNPLNFSKP